MAPSDGDDPRRDWVSGHGKAITRTFAAEDRAQHMIVSKTLDGTEALGCQSNTDVKLDGTIARFDVFL